MKILGIDPGIGRMGWGVIETQGSTFKVQGFGCIETPMKHSEAQRIKQIYEELTQIVEQEQPDGMAIEELFFSKNVTTAFSVGQARGIALLVAAQHDLLVGSYNPGEVKLAVTGYGKAEKRQIGQMVKVILHLQKLPKLDDTTDALAIALTHAFTAKVKGEER